MAEQGLSRNQIFQQLSRSPHGKLAEYVPLTRLAAKTESEFLAHLIAWNAENGQIRDSMVALPVISYAEPTFTGELGDNSLAHLALLDPRNLVRALGFSREVKLPGRQRTFYKVVERYLRAREAHYPLLERAVIQHRASMKTLYARLHIKPTILADNILFKGKYPPGSTLSLIPKLKDMSVREAAGTILQRRIPFLVAVGALGARMKEPDLVLALIEQMSPTELVTNSKLLEKLGVRQNASLRGAYDAALIKAAASKKNVLKTTKAIAAVKDETLKARLKATQEKQIARMSVEGNWLVLGDRSGSMQRAVDTSKLVASTLAKMVKGHVHLVFFSTMPQGYDVQGMDYDEVLAMTRNVCANGGTSIGCGLQLLLDKGIEVDGITIISDGEENNTPYFAQVYKRYCEKFGKEPPVYFYQTEGGHNNLTQSMSDLGQDMQVFDLRHQTVDYYSVSNLVATMNTKRYGLVEQIMDTPLLTLDGAFKTLEELTA